MTDLSPARTRLAIAVLLAAALWLPPEAVAEHRIIEVARFSAGELDGWQPKVFEGQTRYQLRSDGTTQALYAQSHASASGLFREVSIDLNQTPCLHWSWKVTQVIGDLNERSKAGDDYPARLYVVFSGGLRFWRTLAINYVWSNNQPPGSSWPNAFTANSQMVAVRGGSDQLGQWQAEQRNVLADYRRLFGGDAGKVVAVALMSDADNSGLSASAWYGDIWFSSSHNGHCDKPG
ncbi:DUF3047 domain-containing protein [Porticoccus sp.]